MEIAGYYARLAAGFSELGVKADFYSYSRHPFHYLEDKNYPTLLRLSRFFKSFKNTNYPPLFKNSLSTVWSLDRVLYHSNGLSSGLP